MERSFRNAGFTDITFEVEYDIIIGWFADEGAVKSVMVNGEEDFASGKSFRADSKIIITHHDLRKNNPK